MGFAVAKIASAQFLTSGQYILLNASKRSARTKDVTSNNLGINVAFAFGSASAGDAIAVSSSKLRAVKIAGGIILFGRAEEAVNPAEMRFDAAFSATAQKGIPSHPCACP